jgi:hypothetical protein
MRQHWGRYDSKKKADDYASTLLLAGVRAEVVPITCYDVVSEEKENES